MQSLQQAAGGFGPVAGAVGRAKAEAQGTKGVLGRRAPKGQQHMGRVGPARVVTGGPGGNADPRQVEAVGQGLAVKAGQADADQAGQTGRPAVEAGLRPACAQRASEIGRQRALGGGAFGPAGAGQFQRAGQADDLGDRLGARAQPALLAAAEDQRL